jgi:hypothetical protein
VQHGLPPSPPFRRRLRRQRIRRIKIASWALSGAVLFGSALGVLGPPPIILTTEPVAYVPNAMVGAVVGARGEAGREGRALATVALRGLDRRGPASERSGQEPRRRWERRQQRLAERRAERRRERRERRRARRRAERRRERAENAASPEPEYGGSITETIYAAAAEFGVDGHYLLSVAACESDLDPGAVNEVGYYGLFQFDTQTWAAYGYGSIWDPVAQSRTAARLLAVGEADRWPNCT